MKVIFLDIDGVLVTRKSMADSDHHKQSQFDPECVAQLKRILQLTGAVLCISSTWRFHLENLDWELAQHGLPGYIGHTRFDRERRLRGEEIDDWMEPIRGSIERYVILDDDSDFLPDQMSHFVKCSMAHGLTAELADKAIGILNENIS